MKRKTTKEILTESFRELAETKSIDKITVPNIVENCQYSTATFYRHFKDKYDLIAWDYTQDLEKILSPVNKTDYSWRQVLFDASEYYAARREYLRNLILHTSGHDSFVRYMTEINCDHLREMILKAAGAETLNEETEMYIRIYCLGTVHLTCEWILGCYSADKEVLCEVYQNAMPEPLMKYI